MERRHAHGAHTPSSPDGVPSHFDLQRMYWAVLGAFIGAATLANIMNMIIAAQRFSDRTSSPAKPKSFLFRAYATATALIREASQAGLAPLRAWGITVHMPTLGRLSMVLANLAVLMVLCFYKLNTMDEWSWETIGYRTGFMAIAQLPLIILLAGKTNIIGFLTGSGYERLNWLHRWIARTLWLTATVHMAFWFRSWGRYNYIIVKLSTDTLTQRGFAAWCILTYIVIVSAGPVRRLSYEFFVLSHIVTFSGFIAAVWLHSPDEVKAWSWVPIGLLVFDRAVRYVAMAFTNVRLSSSSRGAASTGQRSKWANWATFTPLPGNVTRITIHDAAVSWKPGQHVLLSCHSILPFQSHPFTIASIPSDRKLELLVRAERGGTKKLFDYALKHSKFLGRRNDQPIPQKPKAVVIEGPYGRIRPLRQFDSVVLIASGMGATFTMPLMRDIVEGWKTQYLDPQFAQSKDPLHSNFALTKRIRFIWIVRARAHLAWFIDELHKLKRDLDDCAATSSSFNETRSLEVTIYVTCDEQLSSGGPTSFLPLEWASASQSSFVSQDSVMLEKERVLPAETPLPPETITAPSKATSCLRQSGCCCTRKVTDETISMPPCMCSGAASAHPSLLPVTALEEAKESTAENRCPTSPQSPQSLLGPCITIRSGRPDTRTIIRSILEQAEGESGVVACGPKGLNADVRRSVVSLSDERAVHKGTGAQGIYLHVEEYGF
ncbi:metalloreductase [Coccidioides immitis RS]|uniref:ferric-chelate reductase (NADPH) n=2 Tax=Coccidioides immitis TaxID=5501 RepID=A0A0E1RUF2_COCIM|nr:metalloreductase [Coccidioides immitis RS]EAS27433.1 metalloreductase [Coccidioides immitis RS]KMU88473.1 ferric reductase [Coccidioides immitis H538.4]